MRLKNNDQRTSLFWLAIGLVIAYSSGKYGLGTVSSPGPGLFPFLSGLAITVLALVVFSQQKISQPLEKILPVAIIPKDLSAFNPPNDNMMKNSRSVKAS